MIKISLVSTMNQAFRKNWKNIFWNRESKNEGSLEISISKIIKILYGNNAKSKIIQRFEFTETLPYIIVYRVCVKKRRKKQEYFLKKCDDIDAILMAKAGAEELQLQDPKRYKGYFISKGKKGDMFRFDDCDLRLAEGIFTLAER